MSYRGTSGEAGSIPTIVYIIIALVLVFIIGLLLWIWLAPTAASPTISRPIPTWADPTSQISSRSVNPVSSGFVRPPISTMVKPYTTPIPVAAAITVPIPMATVTNTPVAITPTPNKLQGFNTAEIVPSGIPGNSLSTSNPTPTQPGTTMYYPAGTPIPGTIAANVHSTIMTPSIASCVDECTKNGTCSATHWEASTGICTLLTGPISMAADNNCSTQIHELPYDEKLGPSLYIREGHGIKFPDRVFHYTGNLPERYWQYEKYSSDNGQDKLLRLIKCQQYSLPFLPSAIINDGKLVGVYSSKPLPSGINLQELEKDPNYYILQPDQINPAPPSWLSSGPEVWVVYL